jgi:MFS family permease
MGSQVTDEQSANGKDGGTVPLNQAKLWRHTDFMKLWSGQTISLFGTGITTFALPYTAIALLGAKPAQLGLLQAAGWLPFVLLSLLVGVWVDRHRRLPIMVAANAVRAALIAMVPALAFAGLLRMWQLYVIVLLVGIGTVFFELSYLSYLPGLVSRERLVEGNSKLGASESAADVAGPGLAGILVQLLAAPTVLLLDSASYVLSVISLVSIRTAEARPEHGSREQGLRALRADLTDGLGLVFRNVYLRAIACEGFTYNFFWQFYQVLLLYYGTKTLHLPPSAVGLVLSCGSVGGLVGAVLAPRVVARLGFGPAFFWGTSIGCAAPIVVPLVSGQRPFIITILASAYFVLGIGVSISIIGSISLRQSVTPNDLQGRMNAALRTCTYTAVPVGSLVAGFLGGAHVLGPRLTLLVGGIGLFLPALIIRLSPIPRLRDFATKGAEA